MCLYVCHVFNIVISNHTLYYVVRYGTAPVSKNKFFDILSETLLILSNKDFLNVSIYTDIRDEAHLDHLMKKEPLWDLLTHKEFSDKLFHVAGHSTLLKTMKPQSIPQLAACLAMIRPAKRNLVGQPWDMVMKEVWKKPENGEYYFKKAHAMSYAMAVVVHMNLLCEELSS